MHWRSRSRTVAIGGICLLAVPTTGARVYAQAMQVVGSSPSASGAAGSNFTGSNSTASNANGFNPYDPQWALATPFGFSAVSNLAPGMSQQAYTTKLGSGTVGLFAATNTQDYGARAIGSTGNFFDPLPFSPIAQRGDWFSNLGNSAWRSSFVGSYKSNPNDALLDGLYTTANFGVTSFKTGPAGLPGLTNFTAGNDATAVTATAGVGFQITPQISIEGSFSYTQMPPSTFR
jgi:hypothetical protein